MVIFHDFPSVRQRLPEGKLFLFQLRDTQELFRIVVTQCGVWQDLDEDEDDDMAQS